MKDVNADIRQGAINEMWANQHRDNHVVFTPKQISSRRGAQHSMRLPFSHVFMPKSTGRFIVYQIGGLQASKLGVEKSLRRWRTLETIAKEQAIFPVLYVDNRILPNSAIYISRAQNGAMMLAVDAEKCHALLKESTALTMRLYTSDWFNLPANSAAKKNDFLSGVLGEDFTEAELNNKWLEVKALTVGSSYIIHNGYYCDQLILGAIKAGDTVSVVYDRSLSTHFDIPMKDLSYYLSKIDNIRKFLVQSPDLKGGKFTYHDDIEVFACGTATEGVTEFSKGLYFNRDGEEQIRQVTQQDWGLSSDTLKRIVRDSEGAISISEGFVRVYLRSSVNPRPYSQNANFTHDLFTLRASERLKQMTGSTARIPEWRADELEASNYMKWVSSTAGALKDLNDVYSYYGVQSLLEQFEVMLPGVFHVPTGFKEGGLIMEFDATGLMTNKVIMTKADYTTAINVDVNTKTVRGFPGTVIEDGSTLDTSTASIGAKVSEWAEVPIFLENGKWEYGIEYTDYIIAGDNYIWDQKHDGKEKLLRTADKVLYRDLAINREDIGLAIALFKDGIRSRSDKPFGRLDLWLNGRRLVRGLDYLSIGGHSVIVRNKEWLLPGDVPNVLTVVGHGVPPELPDSEWTFVQDRKVSNNSIYNLHLNRNKEFVIDGLLCSESELAFSEDYSGLTTSTALAARHREGGLIGSELPVSRINEHYLKDIGATREIAETKTKQFEAYLTELQGQVEPPASVTIPRKHSIVSILMAKILQDLRSGKITAPPAKLSPAGLAVLLRPYLSLIEKDINSIEQREIFIELNGHANTSPISLTANEYNLLEQVNDLYLSKRVVMSTFFML